jgi:hypothetical protein
VDIGRVEDSARYARESSASALLAGYDATTTAMEQGMQAWFDYANNAARLWTAMFLNTEHYPEGMQQSNYDSTARRAAASSSSDHGGQGSGQPRRTSAPATSSSGSRDS